MERVIIALIIAALLICSFAKVLYRIVRNKKTLHMCLKFKKDARDLSLYFNYKGKVCGIDSYGDRFYRQFLMDAEGKEVNFLPKVQKEILQASFTSDSQIPDKAYRIEIGKVSLKSYDIFPSVVQFSIQPMANDISVWTIVDNIYTRDRLYNKVRTFVLENPLLGFLYLPAQQIKGVSKKGEKTSLISRVEKVGGAFRLSYAQA